VRATPQVFLSYARGDEEKVKNLYRKLSNAGFKPWMDTKDVLPGELRKPSRQKAIRRSDFFLTCLSANSIDKRGFLQKEIKDALDIWQRMFDSDIYLIPVRLEDCEVPESLRDFQWVNLFEEDGWTRLVKAIQVGIERRAEILAAEEPFPGTELVTPGEGFERGLEFEPYVGPRPFERDDKAFFFGRDHEASDLFSLVIAHRVLLLYAQSGAGKTSLINAGLIPLLEEEGGEVLPLARVQGLIPEDIEPEEIPNLYVFNSLMSWAEDEADPKRLAQMSLADFLKEREHPTDEEGLPSPRVVIFDQFEELFTSYPERWRDREEFFEQVGDALEKDPLLRVVLVMREDHIAQLDPYAPLLPEKLRTRFRLERLREGTALLAVTGPLRDARRSFAEGVAKELVKDLLKVRVQTVTGKTEVITGEFVEPVQLQVVCQSLWRDLPPEVATITRDHLQAFGDVNQALSRFYERCIEKTVQESGVKEGDLRAWFERTLITSAGTRGTVYRGREETGGIPNAAVDVLENLHLIRGEWRAGARWYELTHDRFIEPIQKSKIERTRMLFRTLPVIDEIAAGKEKPVSDDIIGYVRPNDEFEFEFEGQVLGAKLLKGSQLKFFPEYAYIAVRVLGDSMDQTGIAPNDYVILQKPQFVPLVPSPGDIVAVVFRDEADNRAALRRIMVESGRVVFRPESSNPAHKPRILRPAAFAGDNPSVEVVGIAIAVLKSYKRHG
jgi:hypothetical protein